MLRLIHGIGRLVNPQHLPALADQQMSLSQFLALDALDAAGGPLRMAVLAQRSGLQPNELTRVVSGLEQRRWLKRSVDPGDSRARLVRSTTAGTRAICGVRTQATAQLSAVWDDFTHEEWHRFIDSLQRFEQGVRRARAAGSPGSDRHTRRSGR